MKQRWWLIPPGVAVFWWASSALGSYIFLHGIGFPGEWVFPWVQLWIAIPYLIDDGWTGLASLKTWSWCIAGVVGAIMPTIVVSTLLLQRWRDKRGRPSLYGQTGWETTDGMRRGGLRKGEDLF